MSDTFTHDGNRYNLIALRKILQGRPVCKIATSELSWVLDICTADKNRIRRARLSVPVLITITSDNRLVPIDGLHRTAKAVEMGIKQMDSIRVLPIDLERCKI